MKENVIKIICYCALVCATLIANFNCILLLHQEEEPDEVRKLRKF